MNDDGQHDPCPAVQQQLEAQQQSDDPERAVREGIVNDDTGQQSEDTIELKKFISDNDFSNEDLQQARKKILKNKILVNNIISTDGTTTAIIIEIEKLCYRFPGGPPVLKDINLSISAGTLVVIAGENGSGKTTLLRHLNGLLLPDSGTILIDGQVVSEDIRRVRQLVGMVFQNADSQIVGDTVESDVAFGPENLRLASDAEERVLRVDVPVGRGDVVVLQRRDLALPVVVFVEEVGGQPARALRARDERVRHRVRDDVPLVEDLDHRARLVDDSPKLSAGLDDRGARTLDE